MSETAANPTPFPRVVWVALGLEFLERAAFYGVYINLGRYLIETVGFTQLEKGALMGVFTAVRSWTPLVTGTLADRIGFKRSLAISFGLYAAAYSVLYLAPSRAGAWAAVMGIAIAGAFLKPVIPGTVRRHSPDGRQAMGFSLFYASVNAGSVVGKLATWAVRVFVSLQASMINAIVGCVAGLLMTLGAYKEPEGEPVDANKAPDDTLKVILGVFKQPALVVFLVLISGYYLLVDQFYQTFPDYMTTMFGASAPREALTLVNPASIALLQVPVAALAKRVPTKIAIALGAVIASVSMFVMGAVPTLVGAVLSFFIFAIGEMVMAPRYYEFVSSFAPKGREGLYMGLAMAPFGLGGLVGGFLSGGLITKYLPKDGPPQPMMVWGTYAAIGLGCALAVGLFAILTRKKA